MSNGKAEKNISEERIVAPRNPKEPESEETAQDNSGATAKDVNVVRGDDHPQAGRHSEA